MKASGFGYLCKEGARNIWSNRMMSAASIGVLTACLLLVGASVMFSLNIRSMMNYVEAQNEIVVFVEENATEQTLDSVKQSLRAIDNIDKITLVTKQEALDKRKQEFGSDAFLLDDYDDENNPLLDSYVVTLKDIEQMDETVRRLQTTEHIYSVSATKEVASAMVTLSHVVTVAGAIIVAILITVSAVIISNTIKLTIFSRRKEIYIMKYVGATDFFIRLPFVIEGVLLGLLSAVLAYAVLWGVYSWISSGLMQNDSTWFSAMTTSILPFSSFALPLAAGFTLAGFCVGIFGSGLFVKKHLKV